MPSLSAISITSIGSLLQSLRPDRVFVLVDTGTAACCLPLLQGVSGLETATPLTITAGEEHKTLATATSLWRQLAEMNASRRSLLINLGGGMVTDMGGFVASTFKRGIPFVNIPTTLLAMIDAATGGKTGVNFLGLKNEIGTFTQPEAVITDPCFLATLPHDELLSGYGEMLKHALLSDEDGWAQLLLSSPVDNDTSHAARWDDLIPASRKVKEDIVRQDPDERGLRQALNLGHTIGHAIEAHCMGRAGVKHGVAVAHGLVGTLYLSVAKCGFPTDKMRQTVRHIRQVFGYPPITCNDYEPIYTLAMHDKKNHHGLLHFALLKDIGMSVINQTVSKDEFFQALDFMRDG